MKRNPAVAAASAAGGDKIQEAVVEKGIEVVGNAIDKQIANIESAQNKSEAFLNKRVCDSRLGLYYFFYFATKLLTR